MVIESGSCLLKEKIFDLSERDDPYPFFSGLFALVGLLDRLRQSSLEVVLDVRALQEEVALPGDGFGALGAELLTDLYDFVLVIAFIASGEGYDHAGEGTSLWLFGHGFRSFHLFFHFGFDLLGRWPFWFGRRRVPDWSFTAIHYWFVLLVSVVL